MHISIRSINHNFNLLETFLNSLKVKPQIIVCSETWGIIYPDVFNINGYTFNYNNSKINRSDGVAVYVASYLSFEVENVIIDKLNILSLRILYNNQPIRISAIYRCHNLNKLSFTEELKIYLQNTNKINNHFIIGDFNLNILSEDLNDNTFLSELLSFGFLPLFKTITRPNPNLNYSNGSCIDNIYAKTNLNCKPIILEQLFNDHYPIFAYISINNDKNFNDSEINDKSSYINYKKLLVESNKLNWLSILEIDDPEIAVNSLIDMIQSCIKKATKKSNKKKNKMRKEWVTAGILNSIKNKEFIYNLIKIDPKNSKLKKYYNKYCKYLKKVIIAAKILNDSMKVKKIKNDSRKIWNFIDYKLGRKKINKSIPKKILVNETLLNDKVNIINNFNTYYNNIGTDLLNMINNSNNTNNNLLNLMNKSTCNTSSIDSIYLTDTNDSEVSKIVADLKDKSGGVDGINAKTLKLLNKHITSPLTHIANLCINNGTWPAALKKAEIIPIFKSGDDCIMSNYRPISLISNLAKILEKIIHSRLSSYLKAKGFISKRQFGFSKDCGTKDALHHVTELIYEGINDSKAIIGTFIDLKKAFDTVEHEILLKKLECYGIRGIALNLIKSYLNNRQHAVKCGDTSSDFAFINIGVPQGSILGPLLFLIYINDLLEVSPLICSYADDTVIFAIENDWIKAQSVMNNSLSRLGEWFITNKLTLNLEKTVFITFGCNKKSLPSFDLNIHINNNPIIRVTSCKYLGILLDQFLKWDQHTIYVVNKIKYLTYIFYKLRYLDYHILRIIYDSLFLSIVSYGISVWGSAYKNAIKILQSYQNKILKNFKNHDENKLNLNINQLFIINTLVFYYDKLKLEYLNSKSITRHKSIVLKKINKTIYVKSPLIEATKIFNDLPPHLKNVNYTFKKNLKKVLQNHLFL